MSQYTQDPIALSLTLDPGQTDRRSPFDLLMVQGKANPGIATVTGGDRPYWIDVQNVPGQTGNIIWYRGWGKVEGVKVSFQFWEPGQIEEFYKSYLPLFVNNGRPVGVDVEHPSLKANDITKLLLKNTGQMIGDESNGWTVALEFIEYRKAKAITAGAAEGANGPNNKPTARNKLEAAIVDARARAKKTGIPGT